MTRAASPPDAPTATSRFAAWRERFGRHRVVAGILIVFAILGTATLIDVALVYRGLQTVESGGLRARDHLTGGDVSEAIEETERVTNAAHSTARRTGRWHWTLAGRMPAIGRTATTIRGTAEVGATGAAVADRGVALARDLVDDDGRPTLLDGDRIDLANLLALQEGMEALPLQALRDATRGLAAEDDRWQPSRVHAAQDRALGVASGLFEGLERSQAVMEVATAMLGADGPQRYLVAVQNPAELRATGGLIGFLAVLSVDNGRMAFVEPSGLDDSGRIDGTVLLTAGRLDAPESGGVDAPPEYQARYSSVGAATFLPSTNVDPDLPTVAPLILDQYEIASGERLDGVIAIDPVALQLLYGAIGPLAVPAEVAGLDLRLPEPIPGDEIARVLLVDSYEVLGGPSEQRRRYQAEVGEAALRELLGGSWEPVEMARAMTEATGTRHLQLYSRDPRIQESLVGLGMAGHFGARDAADDLLAITTNNIAGNKADAHVAHQVHHHLRLRIDEVDGQSTLTRRVTSGLTVTNAVDLASDRYISTALFPRKVTEDREFDPRPGLVRTWVTTWLPEDASVESVVDGAGDPAVFTTGAMHDRRAIDHFLETANAETTAVHTEASWTGPLATSDGLATYSMTVWRQPKAVADQLHLALEAPAGWQVREVRLEGGGPALGLGPSAYANRPTVEHGDGVVQIDGSITADLRIVVELERN